MLSIKSILEVVSALVIMSRNSGSLANSKETSVAPGMTSVNLIGLSLGIIDKGVASRSFGGGREHCTEAKWTLDEKNSVPITF